MKKFFILIFIYLFFLPSLFYMGASAQNLPDLACVSRISASDSDVVTWLRNPATCYPFVIFMSTNAGGPYLPIDTIDIPDTLLTSINIPNLNADVRWYYLACQSNPSVTSDTIDNREPEPPLIKYVSVNGNNVEIFWNPSVSPETYYYQMYAITSGTQDVAQGRSTDFFSYTKASPITRPEKFVMDSHDSCNIKGLPSAQHTTVFLTVGIDSCAQTAQLNWTPYEGWGGTVNYEIFATFNGAAPVSVSQLLPGAGSFLYQNLKDKDVVCFTVHAISQDGFVSFSNEVCRNIDIAKYPDFAEVKNVTVTSNSNIRIDWQIDSTAEINSMQVWRSNDNSGYTPVATIIAPPLLNSFYTYNDNSVSADAKYYFYKISGNNCKGQTMSDNFGRNILLTGIPENSFLNKIRWNAYEQWKTPVSEYIIFRRTDVSSMEIARVNAATTSYNDNISEVESSDGFFYYTVVAVNAADTIKSFSNEAPVRQPSKIFIPNAFVPDGNILENKIFKPVVLFPIGNTYNFMVFDRWGKKVFESETISDGWDGNINGTPAEQGVYAFVVELTTTTGKTIKEKGTVMLVR